MRRLRWSVATVTATLALTTIGSVAQADDETPAPEPSATSTPTPTPTPTTPKPGPKLIKKTIVIGHSVKGRAIRATYKGYEGAKHVAVVLGQMHGNEKAGPRVVHRMADVAKPLKGTGVWYIVTMNPDGSLKNTRTNARGVDLNRNWPTSGWTSKGKGTITWGGPKAKSEPETRTMLRFLQKYRPDYIASIHQPYGAIAKTGIDKGWESRLKKYLFLPVRPIGVGTPSNKVSPTLTGWYNRWYPKDGTATTIELRPEVSSAYVKKHGAPGILKAAKIL